MTFDEDMREKRLLNFRSQWPWPLTFTSNLIFIATIVQRWVSTTGSLEVPIAFPFWANRRHATDRQTDRVQRLMLLSI